MLTDVHGKKNYDKNKYVYSNNSLLIQYLQLAPPNDRDLDILSMVSPYHTLGSSFMEPFTGFPRELVVSVPKRKLVIIQYGRSGSLGLGSVSSTGPPNHIHIKYLAELQGLELIRGCTDFEND